MVLKGVHVGSWKASFTGKRGQLRYGQEGVYVLLATTFSISNEHRELDHEIANRFLVERMISTLDASFLSC